MKRLISALIVFTLVLTCAMSAVNAANFSTTTTYKTNGDVEVTTVATGDDIKSAMVSYVICDGDTPTDSNIKYIDQKTDTDGDGSVTFTVTDTVTKLDGKKIVMGASAGAVVADPGANDTVNKDDTTGLLLTVDDIVGVNGESITVFVSQVGSSVKTGVNIKVTTAEGEHEFNNLFNLSGDNDYAIQLVDPSGEYLTGVTSIVVTPVLSSGAALSKIAGTDYWVE